MAQTLEHNRSITTAVTVPILEKMDEDLNVIAKLEDEPNDVGGMSATELKEAFDTAGNRIQKFINEKLIPAVTEDGLTEEARTNAEIERVKNEQERVANEGSRIDAETGREAAENQRQENERRRIQAELSRSLSEFEREQAEAARADETAGIVAAARQITDEALEAKYAVLAAMGSAHGVYIGSGEMPEGYDLQIDPNGQPEKAIITAYDLAVENGFTGTVQQWLASLIGPKGDPGEKGDRGEKGDKGDPGAGLETVLPLIPEEASPENKLADKDYVDSAAGKGKTYVLKNKITVSEDVSTLIFTEDDDGNPYDFEEVLVFWTVKKKPGVATATVRLNADPVAPSGNVIVYIYSANMKEYDHCVAARAYIQNGRLFTTFRSAPYGFGNEGTNDYRPESLGKRELSSISFLRFWGADAVTAGSTIEIYALEG